MARTPQGAKLERKAKLLAATLRKLDESLMIVEGKKDEAALRRVGVKGLIVQASGRVRGIADKVAVMGREEAVVLTDNDEAGMELAEMVKDALEAGNVRVDLQARRDLRFVLGLRTMEELPRKLKEFEEEMEERK